MEAAGSNRAKFRSAEPHVPRAAADLQPIPRVVSAPKSRHAPDPTCFSEGENGRENHQERKQAERDKPEDAMTRSVGVHRIDAVVGKRLPDEWNVDEQEHEGGQSEQDDSGRPTSSGTYESDRENDRENDPGRRYSLHDPGRHGEHEPD